MFIVNEMSRKYEGCLQKNIFVENSSLTGQTKNLCQIHSNFLLTFEVLKIFGWFLR